MSKDIRSYFSVSPKGFGGTTKSKSKTKSALSSDDDDKKPSSKVTKISKKSRKTAILSDSEDENPVPKKTTQKKTLEKTNSSEKLKDASPRNIFSDKPVKRVNSATVSKKLLEKEAEFHEDADFEKTLCQLDTSQLEKKYFESPKGDVTINGKRKRREESRQDAETKKKRSSSSSSDGKKSDKGDRRENEKIDERKASKKSPTGNGKKESNDATGKSNRDDAGPAKTSERAKKLNLGKLKSKKTTDIVFEKHPSKKKDDAPKTVDVYEEHAEKKKQKAALYTHYLQRGGARNPGSKPIPKGASNCLAGLSFLITGVLESLEREEAEELIQKYGGRTVKSVSKKTDYMVVGEDAGVSKLEKVRERLSRLLANINIRDE